MARSRSPKKERRILANNKLEFSLHGHGIISNFLPHFVNSRYLHIQDAVAIMNIVQHEFVQHEYRNHRLWSYIDSPPFKDDWFTFWFTFSRNNQTWKLPVLNEAQFSSGHRPS